MDPDWVDVFPIKHGDVFQPAMLVYQRVTTCGFHKVFLKQSLSTLMPLVSRVCFAKASKEVVDLRVECQPSSKLFDLGTFLAEMVWGFKLQPFMNTSRIWKIQQIEVWRICLF